MNRYRVLALPAYIVGISLIVIPLFDAAAQLWPFSMGSTAWRFGAIGLLSNAFIVPSAGLLVLLGTALALEQKKMLRVLGWVSGICAVLIPPVIVLFALDAVQTRVGIRPDLELSFLVASLTAVGKLILAMVTLFAFAIAVRRIQRPASGNPQISVAPVLRTPIKKANAG